MYSKPLLPHVATCKTFDHIAVRGHVSGHNVPKRIILASYVYAKMQ